MQSTWEEAHSVALRDCLEKGMSFAEIARAFNERFGTAYTRNAAIGRARRLELSVPMRERAARALKEAPARQDSVTARGGGMNGTADLMLARLKVLPRRLRLAHLAALIRCESHGSPRSSICWLP